MTDQPPLTEILKRSDAYKSLRAEQAVNACLIKLGWRTTQSPYYLDKKTGKLRELDVVASGHWRKPLKAGDLIAKVTIFVEVKTNSEFHILCSGLAEKPFTFESNEYWIGYSEETRQKIEERLSRFNLENEAVLDFIHHIEKISFPKNTMRTSALRLDPPPVENCFSAFRETNGKTEKDLDNSVLWRATLALRSAVQSAKEERIEGLAIDLATDLEVARRAKQPFQSATATIERHACSLNLYLPIVVIQSRIWSAQSAEPEELKWIRLIQYGTFGDTQDWVDVVNFNYLEEYMNIQSEYFNRSFSQASAKRWL